MATRKQEDFEGELNVVERPKVAKPRRYHVVFHNDDYTTMEFVVHVLTSFFHKTETEATQVMLEIHHKGHGVAGIYTRDIAETKVAQVGSYAKKHGFPLRCTAEPEGSDKDES